MKKTIAICFIVITLVYFFGFSKTGLNLKSIGKINQEVLAQLKDGDIILQTSESEQCEAVRMATNSKFSHCGIIFKEKEEVFIFEAVQPVKITPFKEWITHGKGKKYLVKRLQNPELLDKSKLAKMKEYGKKMLNKDYDLFFEWSDDKIYCSELVWKIYKEGAGIELCPLKKLKDFNLNHPLVKEIMAQRYGTTIPFEEKVIAPSQLAEAKSLITVVDTY